MIICKGWRHGINQLRGHCVTLSQDACAWHDCCMTERDAKLKQGNTEIELTAHVIHDCMT